MKASYRIGVKKLCRQRLRAFIAEHLSDNKIRNARVLCFAGREALEVIEVYSDLGIALKNVVCLEQHRKVYNELLRRDMGFDIRLQTLEEFIATPEPGRFDIVSLDFTGQLGTHENSIYRLAKRGLLQDESIVFTNFCGAREADATKGYYLTAGAIRENIFRVGEIMSIIRRHRDSPEKAARALERKIASFPDEKTHFLNKSIDDRRSNAIHEIVRSALQGGPPGLLDIMFLEWDQDGSLTRYVESYWDELNERPEKDPELAAHYKTLNAAMRKKDDVLPPLLAYDLDKEIEKKMQAFVRKFSKKTKRFRLNVPLLARILTLATEQCLRRPFCVVGAESYKYVSDRGTPMYADLYHLQRIRDFDFFRESIHPTAHSLQDLLDPVRRLSLNEFLTLMEKLRRTGERVAERQGAEPGTPPRIILGHESKLNPRQEPPKPDPQTMKAQALMMLLQSPELTIEDIAHTVNAKPMQVAAWKAHITMGTYSPATKDHLTLLADREYLAGRFPAALQLTKRLLKQQPEDARLINNKAVILSHMGRAQQALRIIDQALSRHPGNPSLLINRADQLFDLKRYSEADTAYQIAASATPENPNTLVSWGHLLRQLDRREEAALKYDAALNLNSGLFEAKRWKAVTLSERGQLHEALRNFDLLVEQHPQEADAYYDRSVVLSLLGEIDRCAADLREALMLSPDHSEALYNLGTHLLLRDENEEAREILLRAARTQPTNTLVLNNLAVACARLNKHGEATDLLSQILKLEPHSLSARTARSRILHIAGFLHESLADCEELIRQSPDSPRYWIERGHVLFKLERRAQAYESFDRATQLDGDNKEALFAKAVVLSADQQYTEAFQLFDSLKKRFPEDAVIRVEHANILADLDRPEGALIGFEEVLKKEPRNASALRGKARVLCTMGQLRESLHYFDESIQLDPLNYDTTYNKATALLKLEEYEEAILAYDACIKMHPNDHQSYCNRGGCKMEIGDINGAVLDFSRAVDLNHQDEAAWENLKKIQLICQELAASGYLNDDK